VQRITIVVPSLAGGGAERVATTMSGYWASRGEHVTVITIDGVASDRYVLAPGVHRRALGLMQPATNLVASAFLTCIRTLCLPLAVA
jgi:hypothetical protein